MIQLFLKHNNEYIIINVKHQYGSIMLFLKTYLHNGMNIKKKPTQLKNKLQTNVSNLLKKFMYVLKSVFILLLL